MKTSGFFRCGLLFLVLVSYPFADALSEIQEPENATLTKAEKRELRKKERYEKRAERRAQVRANTRVIDNPRNADYILLGEDMYEGRGILQALVGRVPGLVPTTNGDISFHGPNSFVGGEILFLLNGIQVSKDFLDGITYNEIDRIECFYGSSAAIYGTRGGAGVISVYTIYYMGEAQPGEE